MYSSWLLMSCVPFCVNKIDRRSSYAPKQPTRPVLWSIFSERQYNEQLRHMFFPLQVVCARLSVTRTDSHRWYIFHELSSKLTFIFSDILLLILTEYIWIQESSISFFGNNQPEAHTWRCAPQTDHRQYHNWRWHCNHEQSATSYSS